MAASRVCHFQLRMLTKKKNGNSALSILMSHKFTWLVGGQFTWANRNLLRGNRTESLCILIPCRCLKLLSIKTVASLNSAQKVTKLSLFSKSEYNTPENDVLRIGERVIILAGLQASLGNALSTGDGGL